MCRRELFNLFKVISYVILFSQNIFGCSVSEKKSSMNHCFFFSFFFLAAPQSLWDSSSPTRDWFEAMAATAHGILTTEPPRDSQPPNRCFIVMSITVYWCFIFCHPAEVQVSHSLRWNMNPLKSGILWMVCNSLRGINIATSTECDKWGAFLYFYLYYVTLNVCLKTLYTELLLPVMLPA